MTGQRSLGHYPAGVPKDVKLFLLARGWKQQNDPVSDGELWRRASDDAEYLWEQAVAVEYMMFVTLGGTQSR